MGRTPPLFALAIGALTAIGALSTGSALAEQPVRPLAKVEGCPPGFYTSGNYCLSSPSSNREAIHKTGKSCPLGWYSAGSYCVKNR